MFDPSQGVEVRVKKFGSPDPYYEYKANSKSKFYAGGRNEAFIVPVSNERFVIEVILHPTLQWKKSLLVSLMFFLDGSLVHGYDDLERPSSERAVIVELKTFTNYIDGQRRKCGRTFGETKMVDDPAFLTYEEERIDLNRRGKIRVEMQCGRYKDTVRKKKKSKNKAKHSAGEDSNAAQPLETVFMSEESIKKVSADRGRTHYMKPLLLPREASGTMSDGDNSDNDLSEHEYSSEWAPSKSAGSYIVFEFTYASREFLEREGIAPWMTFTNTQATAVEVDSTTALPFHPSPTTLAGPSRVDQAQSAMRTKHPASQGNITYVSTKHVGKQKRVKIEARDGNVGSATDDGISTNETAITHRARAWPRDVDDMDDAEHALHVTAQRETTEDLYSSTPPPLHHGLLVRIPLQLNTCETGTAQAGLTYSQDARRGASIDTHQPHRRGGASDATSVVQTSPPPVHRPSGAADVSQTEIAKHGLDGEVRVKKGACKVES